MNRKIDHIELAKFNQIDGSFLDSRFDYEPLLSGHPAHIDHSLNFLNKRMKYPLWISSMTGGMAEGKLLNERLALICRKYQLGMGLGSIRKLLDDDRLFDTFDFRPTLGEEVPFVANLGIAQVENILNDNKVGKLEQVLQRLKVDCLMIHVNPLQEWMQKGGDRYFIPPFISIKKLAEQLSFPIGVKEVGQGMGPKSIQKLLTLPVRVFEFAAFGGTNFTKMELLRLEDKIYQETLNPLITVGHDAISMIDTFGKILLPENGTVRLKEIIISGGVESWKDGMYYIDRFKKISASLKVEVVFGQAFRFLEYAKISLEALDVYTLGVIHGMDLYRSFLSLKNNVDGEEV